MGGRGSGKTRAGAEWVRQLARDGVSPIALVGETMTEALDIMVRGESGIMAVHRDDERPVLRGKNHLSWPNGVAATILTASDPERFRGPQGDADFAGVAAHSGRAAYGAVSSAGRPLWHGASGGRADQPRHP
ncbi:hypothetical protein JEQ47_10585 [Devosia sp. MSA67]|uniref:Uncharacterized protein n=1 Tax=Devosia sediminis TaxID=2798801 RepID=A0A934IQW6_9HYPH|nr:terminase family protein [Devosia sediminis]MBJ3785168.1 hypothetical protein [Devosia sediminis]